MNRRASTYSQFAPERSTKRNRLPGTWCRRYSTVALGCLGFMSCLAALDPKAGERRIRAEFNVFVWMLEGSNTSTAASLSTTEWIS